MKHKVRGNGQGCAYKRGSTWTAQVIIGYRPSKTPDHQNIPVKRTKGGFHTKRDALAYCFSLKSAPTTIIIKTTLQQLYDEWYKFYSPRIVSSTMGCYQAAFIHFKPLHDTYIDLISAYDLQTCMDNCPNGKRTHQNMKCLAGLLWAYAIDRNLVQKDVTENLYIGKHQTKQRDPITQDEVTLIGKSIGMIPYAEYIYCLCYLGFRPGELLALKKEDFHTEKDLSYLVGGSKTDAGRGRRVPVPDKILPYIQDRLMIPGTDLLFPQYVYSKTEKPLFRRFKQMDDSYLRESIFKPMAEQLGISKDKSPYCARHTYSDKLKHASGDDKTKAALMGHTDYAFTQSKYQSVDLEDIKTVAKTID